MSPRRHTLVALASALAACTLLSGCFGSGGQEPTAAHRRHHHKTAPTSEPTSLSTSPTVSTSPSTGPILTFSPRSNGKHSEDCERLQPGDDPAEFLYYPVLVSSPSAVTLQTVATEHTQGVVDAGAWVAPVGPTPETGTFKGWPPSKFVTTDSNLQWSKRVAVNGAKLEPGVSYNVFLRVQVDPTPGDSEITGIDFAYQDVNATSQLGVSLTWKAHTTFSMSC